MAATTSAGDEQTETQTEMPAQLIPLLPDDVALNCLARVPRCHHPILSLVSKTFRSLPTSSLLYATRSLVGAAENILYVAIRLPPESGACWFTLLHRTLSNSTNSSLLLPIPSCPSPSLVGSAYVVVGSEIYVIGGSIRDVPSSSVWVLDCRFHTWRRVCNMRVGREFAAAGVIDGKIYVIGGCVVDNWARSINWAEMFDIKTQTWEPVASPGMEVREKWMHASAVMEGKVYAMADRNGVVYEPKENKWGMPEKRLDLGWRGRACVIDNILYCYDYLGKIRGYVPKERVWRELKGVESLPKFLCGATMANRGGKLVVLWEGKAGSGGSRRMDIWCAEIDVERRGEGEIWGKIDWSGTVLTVPNESAIVNCLAATV
ncbi:PREDICTED: F-box/kelch-repeat protein SKIP6 [Camelina sativa]|uniref:F-box/kelch-repeat protein SKIP6 n=1 Tax=Camelina sativa TaxID=90675 RepID=A0ABM0SW16_CAMSA|nr:PREDICTED: F-box/kelch-repeat protein SKIP6 [Camelina sativa]